MAFHSKSVVGFGQLLTSLAGSVNRGTPMPEVLDVVKDHFSATVVLLGGLDGRGESYLVADSAHAKQTDHPGRAVLLRALMEEYQHVSASEPRADGKGNYTLWIFRERGAARFDNEETALAGIVVSQLARALDLAERLDNATMENALYADALECLHVGVIIADETGRILRLSPLAEGILAAREGLQQQSGKLRATNVAEDRDLQALIRAVAGGEEEARPCNARGLSLTKKSGLRTLGMVARPVAAPRTRTGGQVVCIYLRDFDTEPCFEGDIVRQILDLTPAEAAMTRRLASGLSLEDAALSLDISRNTARAHLRSIFSKNGITRQTELVRMVLNSAALLGAQSATARSGIAG